MSCFAMTASPPAAANELRQLLGMARRSYSSSLERCRAFLSGSGWWASAAQASLAAVGAKGKQG